VLVLSGDQAPAGSLGSLIAGPDSFAPLMGESPSASGAAGAAAGSSGPAKQARGNTTEASENATRISKARGNATEAGENTTTPIPTGRAFGWYTTQYMTIIRESPNLRSRKKYFLPKGRMVYVVEQSGRRVRITIPMPGWMSLHAEDGREVLRRNDKPPTAEDLAGNLGGMDNFRQPDGSLDPKLLADALEDSGASKVSKATKEEVRKAVHNVEQLGHGFKGISKERVDEAAEGVQKKERRYEAALSEATNALLGATSQRSEEEFNSDAEKEVAREASKIIEDQYHTKVDIPAEIPDHAQLPESMPKELTGNKLKEEEKEASKYIAKELGHFFGGR
jgi:hypothetical protein